MHDHQSEVVSEGVSDEEPATGEVLEPDLRLRLGVFAALHINKREAATLAFGVDFKRVNVTRTLG